MISGVLIQSIRILVADTAPLLVNVNPAIYSGDEIVNDFHKPLCVFAKVKALMWVGTDGPVKLLPLLVLRPLSD